MSQTNRHMMEHQRKFYMAAPNNSSGYVVTPIQRPSTATAYHRPLGAAQRQGLMSDTNLASERRKSVPLSLNPVRHLPEVDLSSQLHEARSPHMIKQEQEIPLYYQSPADDYGMSTGHYASPQPSRRGTDKAPAVNGPSRGLLRRLYDGERIGKTWARPFERHLNGFGHPDLQAADGSGAGGDDDGLLEGWSLYMLTLAVCLVIFVISLDRTIITTAIPFITSEFQSTGDIGWYGSSYLITTCGFQPVFGRVYTLFNMKWTYLLSLVVFELGSLICAIAPSSGVLIIGRSVAGFGSAGILTGSFVILATGLPLRIRPIYTAAVGLMFGVGATSGPLIGGVFTDLVSWRWCFWINLPIGAVTIIAMFFAYQPPKSKQVRTALDRVLDLDIIGNVLLLAAAVMLFTSLEFTATGEEWDSVLIIGMMAGFGLTTILFLAWQWWKQDGALMPPAIASQRTVAASCITSCLLYGCLTVHAYFLPIWFQAIMGDTAIESGVAMIGYMMANVMTSVLAGAFTVVTGYFTPPAILGGIIATVGCGLLSTLHGGMTTLNWVAFEVVAAVGFGMAIQQGYTSVQAVLKPKDAAIGTAAVVAAQSLGGAVFVSAGNNILQSRIRQLMVEAGLPGLDGQAVAKLSAMGATAFRHLVPADQLPLILGLYNKALQSVFTMAIPLAGLGFLASCFMEFKSVKKVADAQSTPSRRGSVVVGA